VTNRFNHEGTSLTDSIEAKARYLPIIAVIGLCKYPVATVNLTTYTICALLGQVDCSG